MDISQPLQEGHGVLVTGDHRSLRSTISREVRAGRLVRPVPGVACTPEVLQTPEGLLRVAHAWQPAAVVHGPAAAWLWWGGAVTFQEVHLHGSRTATHGRFHVDQGVVPANLVSQRQGLLVTSPDLTVLDCLATGRRDVLHDALRLRSTTLARLRDTLEQVPSRPGKTLIAQELWRARENPWSDGEDDLHEFLRQFGFRRWKGNHRVIVRGRPYYLDAAFEAERLAVELDGLHHHWSPEDRQWDCERRMDLAGAGWRVVILTTRMIHGSLRTRTAENLHQALRQRAARRPGRRAA